MKGEVWSEEEAKWNGRKTNKGEEEEERWRMGDEAGGRRARHALPLLLSSLPAPF